MAINTVIDYHERFDNVDKRLQEMSKDLSDQSDKLASAILKGFNRIDNVLEAKADKTDLQRVYDLLDMIAKQQQIDDDERIVMGHQLDRLDRWVHEVAKKIGNELSA